MTLFSLSMPRGHQTWEMWICWKSQYSMKFPKSTHPLRQKQAFSVLRGVSWDSIRIVSGRYYLWKSVCNYLSHRETEATIVLLFIYFLKSGIHSQTGEFEWFTISWSCSDDVTCSGYNHFNVEFNCLGDYNSWWNESFLIPSNQAPLRMVEHICM